MTMESPAAYHEKALQAAVTQAHGPKTQQKLLDKVQQPQIAIAYHWQALCAMYGHVKICVFSPTSHIGADLPAGLEGV